MPDTPPSPSSAPTAQPSGTPPPADTGGAAARPPARIADAGPAIPRDALERVLARASELQLATADTPDEISETQLLEIGREVGLDATALRQAIAEERNRPAVAPEPPGRLAESLGTAAVAAQRTVSAPPDQVLASLDEILRERETFQRKRRAVDRWSWEPRRDPFRSLAAAFQGRSDLIGVEEISAAVAPADGTRTHVRLDASTAKLRRDQRTSIVVAWVANGLVGVTWLVPLLVLMLGEPPTTAAAALLPAAGAAGAAIHGLVGWLSFRGLRTSYRRAVVRAQERLEQLLDELEHGDPGRSPKLLDQLRKGIAALERL